MTPRRRIVTQITDPSTAVVEIVIAVYSTPKTKTSKTRYTVRGQCTSKKSITTTEYRKRRFRVSSTVECASFLHNRPPRTEWVGEGADPFRGALFFSASVNFFFSLYFYASCRRQRLWRVTAASAAAETIDTVATVSKSKPSRRRYWFDRSFCALARRLGRSHDAPTKKHLPAPHWRRRRLPSTPPPTDRRNVK